MGELPPEANRQTFLRLKKKAKRKQSAVNFKRPKIKDSMDDL